MILVHGLAAGRWHCDHQRQKPDADIQNPSSQKRQQTEDKSE